MNNSIKVTDEEREEIRACVTGYITLWNDSERSIANTPVYGEPKIIYVEGSPFFSFLHVSFYNANAYKSIGNLSREGFLREYDWRATFTWRSVRINAIKSFARYVRS